MCGIVGGVTNKNITSLLLEGLNRLEYRGYDSSGLIVLSKNNTFDRARSVGRVKNLEDILIARDQKIQGNIGIAHTRWATHGEPSISNAHPHISKNSVSLVHNGIIENYIDLKNEQLNRGYSFSSDTDTEVLVNLIEDMMLKNEVSLPILTQQALQDIVGAYALSIFDINKPDELVVVKNGSPLVIGIGEGEVFIASDVSPFIEHTNKVIYLEDREMAIVNMNNV